MVIGIFLVKYFISGNDNGYIITIKLSLPLIKYNNYISIAIATEKNLTNKNSYDLH